MYLFIEILLLWMATLSSGDTHTLDLYTHTYTHTRALVEIFHYCNLHYMLKIVLVAIYCIQDKLNTTNHSVATVYIICEGWGCFPGLHTYMHVHIQTSIYQVSEWCCIPLRPQVHRLLPITKWSVEQLYKTLLYLFCLVTNSNRDDFWTCGDAYISSIHQQLWDYSHPCVLFSPYTCAHAHRSAECNHFVPLIIDCSLSLNADHLVQLKETPVVDGQTFPETLNSWYRKDSHLTQLLDPCSFVNCNPTCSQVRIHPLGWWWRTPLIHCSGGIPTTTLQCTRE